jgi:hypothetical protein
MTTPPFVSNTEDDLHCLQAAFMIVLKHFEPNMHISWDEWSDITGFEPDKGTWPLAGLMWFKQRGYDVCHIEQFDFKAFGMRGAEYLKERFSGESGEWAVEHTNVPAEQQRAAQFSQLNLFDNRNPTINDIESFIDSGYLVRASVNARALNNKKGYAGHAVIVYAYDKDGITLHDPGLPAIPARKVAYPDFERAWFDPEDGSAEISALKLAL